MNNIKKALCIVFVITLMMSMLPQASFAAAPTVEYGEFMPFNSKPAASQDTSFYTDGRLRPATECTSADYVGGVFGKSLTDYSLVLDAAGDGVHDYNLAWGKFSQAAQSVGTTLHYGYEFAFASDATAGVEQFVAILNSNGTVLTSSDSNLSTPLLGASATNRVIEFETGAIDADNKVILFGQLEADFAWQRGQWYTVDILITKGSAASSVDSYMSVYVNGAPLKVKGNQTIDGVKTTTQKFLIDAAHNIDAVQPLETFGLNNFRIKNGLADSARGNVYVDNVKAYAYSPGSDNLVNVSMPVYDYYDWIDTDFSDGVKPDRVGAGNGASLAVVNEDGNNVLAHYRTKKYTNILYGTYLGIEDADKKSDVMLLSFDLRTNDTSTGYAISDESTRPFYMAHSSLDTYVVTDPLNVNEKLPSSEIMSKSAREALIGTWINHKIVIDRDDVSHNYFINGLPQMKYPAARTLTNELRIQSGLGANTESITEYLAIDNLRVIGQNYYPTIKSLTYTCDGVDYTNDYAVPVDSGTIVAKLESKIIDASQSNIDKIKLVDFDGNEVSATKAYNDTAKTVTFSLNAPLSSNKVYKIIIPSDLAVTDSVTMGTDFEYGFKTGFRPFEVMGVKLMSKLSGADDYSYHTTGKLTSGTTINAELTFTNTSGSSQTCTAILAVYDAMGVLKCLDVKPATIGQNSDPQPNNVVTFDNGVVPANVEGCIVKAYVCESIGSMRVISPTYYLWQNTDVSGGNGSPEY